MVNFLSLLWHLLKLFFGFIFISFLSVSGPVRAEKGPLFMRGCLSAVFLCQCWAGRRSARAFGVWPPFPPPHLTLSHTGLLVCAFRRSYQISGPRRGLRGADLRAPSGCDRLFPLLTLPYHTPDYLFTRSVLFPNCLPDKKSNLRPPGRPQASTNTRHRFGDTLCGHKKCRFFGFISP